MDFLTCCMWPAGVENRSSALLPNSECEFVWVAIITSADEGWRSDKAFEKWHPRGWNAFQGIRCEDLPKDMAAVIERAMAASGHKQLIPWWKHKMDGSLSTKTCVGLVRFATAKQANSELLRRGESTSPWYIARSQGWFADAAVAFSEPVGKNLSGICKPPA